MRQSSHSRCIYLVGLFAVGILSSAAVQAQEMPPLFFAMKHKMSYMGERQAILSKNIANANTPHYKTRDLTPFDKKTAVPQRKITMSATNPNHFSGNTAGNRKYRIIKDKNTFETTIAGNNVSLDEEMRKVAENNLDYQATTNLYKKWSGVMHTAISGAK